MRGFNFYDFDCYQGQSTLQRKKLPNTLPQVVLVTMRQEFTETTLEKEENVKGNTEVIIDLMAITMMGIIHNHPAEDLQLKPIKSTVQR